MKHRNLLTSLLAFTTLAIIMTLFYQRADAKAWTSELDQIEMRLQSYLGNYLQPDEFMVYVTESKIRDKRKKRGNTKSPISGLPGVPGLDSSDYSISRSTYFDIDGRMHQPSVPIAVSVVISKSVAPQKAKLLRTVLPRVARIDRSHGDSFKLSIGDLRKAEEDRSEKRNFIESMIRNKEVIGKFGLGLGGLFVFLVILHGIFTLLAARQGSPREPLPLFPQPDGSIAPMGPERGRPSEDSSEASGKKRPTRHQLYSKDSAVYELIQELGEVGQNHPERIAQLLTEWIQTGEVGIKNAATFLHNFNLKSTEGILAKMVPTDMDYMRPYINTNFDPFSDENIRVVFRARQELMKITAATTKGRVRANRLEFLTKLDDYELMEVLKLETPQDLALICTSVPAHRMSNFLKTLHPSDDRDFFSALVDLQEVDKEEFNILVKRLRLKVKQVKNLAFTKASKVKTMASIIEHIPSPSRQENILSDIQEISPDLTSSIREKVYIFEDILTLPDKLLRILLLDQDPMTIVKAFYSQSTSAQDHVRESLTDASREIFDFEVGQSADYSTIEIEKAQQRLIDGLKMLIEEGAVDADTLSTGLTPEKGKRPAA